MICIDFNGIISSETDTLLLDGGEFQSVSKLRQLLKDNPDDDEICLNIDCDGGSVEEGFKIYDELRNSGKTVYTNISGACHSMAVCVLLAAPYHNRSASRNSRALIHRVYSGVFGMVNSDDAAALSDMLKIEEEAILELYSDRTGQSKDSLREVMRQEKTHTAKDLLQMGFISRINPYNTNQFFVNMSKTSSTFEGFMEKVKAFKNKLAGVTPVNYDYLDPDGNVVLSTEGDEDNLAVGVAATLSTGEPSGTVTLDDGRVVTVTDNVVTEIVTAVADSEEDNSTVNELQELLDEAANLAKSQQDTIDSLNARIDALTVEVNNLKGSNYEPKSRKSNIPSLDKSNEREVTVEELKAQAREAQVKVMNSKNIRK